MSATPTSGVVGAPARPVRRPRLRLPAYLPGLVPIIGVLLVFFVIPFLASLYASLQSGGSVSLGHYERLLGDTYYLGVLAKTFGLGLAVTLLAFVLGYPAGHFLARTRSPLKPLFIFLIISPLVISVIIRSYGWLILLGNRGLVNTVLLNTGVVQEPVQLVFNWVGVVVALTHVLLPYMVLSVAALVESIDPSLEQAARVFGASRWQAFRLITFPLSIEGVGTGSTLVFMLAIGSFVTILLLGGTETMVLPLLIYQQVTVTMNNSFAAALGSTLLLISLGLLYAQTRIFRVRGRG